MSENFYPPETHIGQMEEVLRLLIVRGSLTHKECEEMTAGGPVGEITTLRSQISDIRLDWGWGNRRLRTHMESHGNGKHARYILDFTEISGDIGLAADLLKEVALNAISRGKVVDHYWRFLDLVKGHKAADLRKSYAILKAQPKAGPDQLGLVL